MTEDEVETPEKELSPDVEEAGEADPQSEDSPVTEGAEQKDSKAEKRVRDAQEALRKSNEEKARLSERLARLEGMVEVATRPKEEAQARKPFGYLDDEGTVSTLYDDPTNIQKVLKNLVGDFVTVLDQRDKAFLEQVREKDPDYREMKTEVDKLAADPDFADWPREALVKMAKKFTPKATPPSKPDGFRPGPGSRKAPSSSEGTASELVEKYYKMLGYKD
jgi:chromosome segregation ATPase